MKQFRLLTLLALLMTAATGAWAKVAGTVTVTHSDQSVSNYGSLAEVFALSGDENANLQDGDVVTLLDDQTGLTESLTLYGKKITFDLNGHRVSSSERVFNLTGSADLTLTSSQEGGTVNATFADTEVNHYAIRVGEGCKLTIPESSKHFTISSNNTCIFDNGKVVIAGSPTISGTKGGFYSVEATQPVELTISGSPTITSDGYGFFVLSPSCQLTISGAPTISGKVNGIFAYCPVTISGQPKISSQGAAGQMGAIVPYDIMAYQLTIGGKAEHPATLDFTGTKATGNIILYYPISITGPVALGSADKWNVTIMDSEGFPTTGTFTSGWTTNMTDAAIADYFTGGQLSDGTNLIVTTDADGEGALAPTYSVSLNDGTLNPTTWTAKAGEATTFSALPLKGVTEGQPVTLKYNGRLKVKNVTATTDYDPLATPLTIEAITPGTIQVYMTGTLSSGMKYSVNGGTKTLITESTDITVAKDDKVQFYGNGTQTKVYGGKTVVSIQGTGDGFQTKVYGNIMSLLDETGFATKTDLPNAEYVFFALFRGNATLIDASELLLPAATLTNACYQQMFESCINLTTAPKLPAMTLADGCYAYMFSGCQLLTAAPKLPATTLDISCYYCMFNGCTSLTSAYVKAAYTGVNAECASMFDGCTADGAVLHTTSDNKASWEAKMGSGTNWSNWSVADDWQD